MLLGLHKISLILGKKYAHIVKDINMRPHEIILRNGITINLKEAHIADADALIELNKHIFRRNPYTLTTFEEYKPSIQSQRQLINYHYKNEGSILLLAWQKEQLIGSLSFRNGNKKRIKHVGKLKIGIHPDYENQGVEKIFLNLIINWASRNTLIEKISSSVVRSNKQLLQQYKTAGFTEEGQKSDAFKLAKGGYYDLIEMSLFVR